MDKMYRIVSGRIRVNKLAAQSTTSEYWALT